MYHLRRLLGRDGLVGGIALTTLLSMFGISIGLVIKLGRFLAETLDKMFLKELVFYNGLMALGLLVLILLVWRLRRSRNVRETAGRIMSQRRARISLYVIIAYFLIGSLNLIHLPKWEDVGDGKIIRSQQTVLDLAFSGLELESTYSSPLASRVEYSMKQEPTKSLHLLGTDINGQDILYLTMKGCATALLLSFGSCLIVFPLAILFGVLSGYFGGWVDDLIIWLYTTISSIPFLLFVIALIIQLRQSLTVMIVAFGLTSWVGTCRLLRGETIRQKTREYVEAARVQGASHLRIIFRHILPNIMHLVIIQFSLLSSGFIFAEAILSFLGIGLGVNDGSWGAMITKAQDELIRDPTIWWPFIAAGFLGIFPIVLALNIFGDVTRDALDPKLRQELVR